MKITLLGTRGSVPNPCKDNILYGGNTQCVSVVQKDCNIMLDGGTGLLSAPSITEGTVFHILLSHYHLDHINGIPLFAPLFDPSCTIHFYGGAFEGEGIHSLLKQIFRPPFWPICLDEFSAKVEYHTVVPGESFKIEQEVSVSTIALNHPNGAVGYALEYGEKRLCYISDHEHTREFDEPISAFVAGCDMMIADACYTPEQYSECKVGFGHSVFEEIAQMGERAGVKKLVIIHHDGDNNDERLAVLEEELRKKHHGCIFGREGSVTEL